MRQTTWAASALAALLLTAAGCGDDDDNNNGTPRPTATRTATRTATLAVPTETPGGPTRTPTATPIPNATNTPGGGSASEATVQRFLSGVLSTVATLSDFAGGGSQAAATSGRAAIQLPPIAVPCPNGGTIQTGCTPDGGGANLTFTFAGCTTQGGGVRSFLDGTIAIDSPAGCPGVPLPVGQPFGVEVDATIEVTGRGENVGGSFNVVETVTLNADGSAVVEADGSVDTECTGAVSFETLEPLVYPANGDCATGGAMRVTVDGEASRVVFTAGGGLDVDYGDDGSIDESYASCTDPSLESCG